MNIDTTRLAANLRQLGALAAVIMGVLTSPQVLNILPPAVSAVLVGAGGLIFGIEHHNANTSAQNPPGAPQTSGPVPTTPTTAPAPPPTLPPTKA